MDNNDNAFQAWWESITQKEWEVFQNGLTHPEWLNRLNPQGKTALVLACEEGSDDMVKTLLSHGASWNPDSKGGPIQSVIQKKRWNLIQPLVDAGVDLNTEKIDEKHLLTHLIHQKEWEGCHVLMDNGAVLEQGKEKVECFIKLVQSGGLELLSRLKENRMTQAGLDFFVTIAANHFQWDVMRWLLEQGASWKACDARGAPVWTIVVECALWEKVENGVWEPLKVLVENGWDVNAKDPMDDNHKTALEKVLLKNRSDCRYSFSDEIDEDEENQRIDNRRRIAKWLLERGADVNQRDPQGYSLLHRLIVFKKGEDLFESVLKAGADLNNEPNGESVLMIAVSEGLKSLVNIVLKEPSVSLNHQCNEGETALTRVIWAHPSLKFVPELIEAGAGLDLQNKAGDTALMRACRKGVITMVQELIDAGAGLQHKNEVGEDALRIACRWEHTQVIHALLKAGADVNDEDIEGVSVLMNAVSLGCEKAVRVLLESDALRVKNWEKVKGRARRTGVSSLMELIHHAAEKSLLENVTGSPKGQQDHLNRLRL